MSVLKIIKTTSPIIWTEHMKGLNFFTVISSGCLLQVVHLFTLDKYTYLRQNEPEAFRDENSCCAATKLLNKNKKVKKARASLFLTC